MSSPTVIVIDDHREILENIHRFLVRNGYRVLVYDSPDTFAKDCRDDDFYLKEVATYLVDVNMPGLNGHNIQTLLTNLGADAPVVFMSGNPTIEGVNDAWRNGAFEFLVKPFEPKALLDVLERSVVHYESRRSIPIQLACDADPELAKSLTRREMDVLKEIVSGATIAESASRMSISERTVKLHRQNLRKRLGINRTPDLVRFYDLIRKDA